MHTHTIPEQRAVARKELGLLFSENRFRVTADGSLPNICYDSKNRFLFCAYSGSFYKMVLQILYGFYFNERLNPYQLYSIIDFIFSLEVQTQFKKTSLKINHFQFIRSKSKSCKILWEPNWFRFGFKSNPYHKIFSVWKDYVFLGEPGDALCAETFDLLADDSFVEFERFVDYTVKHHPCNAMLAPIYNPVYKVYPDLQWYDVEHPLAWLADFARHVSAHSPHTVPIELPQAHDQMPLGNWRDFYSQDIANKVYAYYRKDFEFFGYEKDSWSVEGEKSIPLKRGADLMQKNWYIREIAKKNQSIKKRMERFQITQLDQVIFCRNRKVQLRILLHLVWKNLCKALRLKSAPST